MKFVEEVDSPIMGQRGKETIMHQENDERDNRGNDWSSTNLAANLNEQTQEDNPTNWQPRHVQFEVHAEHIKKSTPIEMMRILSFEKLGRRRLHGLTIWRFLISALRVSKEGNYV